MGDIGASIFNGIMGAAWALVSHVPIMIWVIIAVGIIGAVFILRYLTNWKVDIFLMVTFLIVMSIITWRAHWINQGYNEAMDKVKAADARVAVYKATNAKIMACYARNSTASILWDRESGACVRADGSHL